MNISRFSFFLVCLAFAGCTVWRAQKLERRYWTVRPAVVADTEGQSAGSVQIQYTGCGGYLVDYAGEIIMLDPFFSNISMFHAATRSISTDTALVNDFFRKYFDHTRDTAGRIGTVLLSHAHHDHLADLPALLQTNLSRERLRVFGSRTVVNLLRSYPDILPDTSRQLTDLERQFKLLSTTPGIKSEPEASAFIYTANRRMRFAAIPSDHAGHYRFFYPRKLPFTKGNIDQPLPKPPAFALNFKEGQNFNYLIDLLDERGAPVFRIFSNAGSACDAGVGFPPEYLLKEKSVDLLLICGANYNIAKNYPLPLIEYLRPASLFVVHWENFFQPIPRLHSRPEVVPNTNMPKLMHLLEAFAQKHGFPKTIILEQPLSRAVMFEF